MEFLLSGLSCYSYSVVVRINKEAPELKAVVVLTAAIPESTRR